MDFSTEISSYNMNYNLNAVTDYNNYLKEHSSFEFDDAAPTQFEKTLEKAYNNYPIKNVSAPESLENFMGQIGNAFGSGLNAVNNAKLEANRMQEDIAAGGSTNIHDAMIAAEKASLSMQMAMQVRNRILSAYTEITGMMI